jgi:hypothetical protein
MVLASRNAGEGSGINLLLKSSLFVLKPSDSPLHRQAQVTAAECAKH